MIKNLLANNKEKIMYLIFGGLTTIVNILAFQIARGVQLNLFYSNLIAWILSVIFAFVTNKLFVFEKKSMDFKVVCRECVLFFGARIFSLVIDMVLIIVLVDFLSIMELISKLISNVVVIVMNYFLSKLIIFKGE